jgi:glycosyltransferase involved in cell wall biosynthesis
MSRGCVLHVAALPFPSYQGTQAAIRAMLEASTRAGRSAELFTYATAGYPLAARFVVHRTGALPRVRSLRSGPSVGKLLLDLRMLCELQSLVRRLHPSAIIAHHVEAAALALALPRVPSVFFAHTDLAAELPSYAPARQRAWLSWAGARVDRSLTTRADAVATISRTLSARLEPARATRSAPIYVPTPWRVPEPISSDERRDARRALGLAADSCVALYAGNLDTYQGACGVLDALHTLSDGRRIHLLIATHSEVHEFLRRAALLGVPCRATTLGDEAVRRRIHAAADIAIVPRAIPGGLPIKLLDALSRGLPCAVSPHATAGLALTDSVVCARESGSRGLAEAIASLACTAGLRRTLSERGRAYISREHSDAAFLTSLDRVLALAIAQRPTYPATTAIPKLRARASSTPRHRQVEAP